MNFDFTTKESRCNAAREFANELKQHLTEEEAVIVSYSDDEDILNNGVASYSDLERFIVGMLYNMPTPLALILLRRVINHLTEDDSKN